jgi:Na+/proline symporter
VFTDIHIAFPLIAIGSVALVWLYTQKSGIKTIVWTDALQTTCLITALILIILAVSRQLNLNVGEMIEAVADNPHSRIFVWDDWFSRQHFVKQFLSGIFIVIVMTGLDQDMMQKNLSCRSLPEAKKNMYTYGFAFIPLNLLFLGLGVLLLILTDTLHINLPATGDDLLPMLATEGYLGQAVLVFFTIGIIAASFSNSDSALTAMTTSFCVDILDTDKEDEHTARRKRRRVHAGMSVLLVLCICFFGLMDSPSLIDAIYVIASYTYGPLLGMFAFGLFTRRAVYDRWTPYIAVASPMLCYLIDVTIGTLTGYRFGYELLMLNGLLTFAGLYLSGYYTTKS